jgi:hypothetical protein
MPAHGYEDQNVERASEHAPSLVRAYIDHQFDHGRHHFRRSGGGNLATGSARKIQPSRALLLLTERENPMINSDAALPSSEFLMNTRISRDPFSFESGDTIVLDKLLTSGNAHGRHRREP